MIEDLINKAKKDKRVDIDCVINNNIHMFKATGNNKNEKAILYVHGLGANKNWVTRFCRQLLDNNIDVYSIDLVSHGNDITSFKKFNVTNCVQYIKDALNYLKSNYNKVYLFGSSYGGFVILNAYNEVINYVENIYLMCPVLVLALCFVIGGTISSMKLDQYYKTIVPKEKSELDSKKGARVKNDDIDDFVETSEIIIGKNIRNLHNRSEIEEIEAKYSKNIPYYILITIALSIMVVAIGFIF